MNIKGTQTEKNLRAAFAGESMARNKYTFFAEYAKKAGNDDVAAVYERLAKNEMMHAKFWFEMLYGKNTPTIENLMIAAKGEHDEYHDMYPEFAKTAQEEGFDMLAVMFEKVAGIEQSHEREFLSLIGKLSAGQAEEEALKQQKTGYRCQFCGHVTEDRLDVCPVCEAIASWDTVTYEE